MAESEADCIFCKILAGELPGEVVQEDEHTVAFMDINPWTRGHAVVIPRRHSRNLWEIEDEDLERTVVAAKRLALQMRERLDLDGVNLINSCEPAAWQTIFHLHVHVIPRYDDDPLQLPTRPRRAEPEELAEVAADIFGEHRVRVARRLDDAIEQAVTLAETGGVLGESIGSGGVLVTGSVVTVGEARVLLRRAGDRS